MRQRLGPATRLASLAISAVASLIPLATSESALAQPKRVYIGLDDHTDYTWNSTEAANRQSFLDMLDYYLDLKDATASNPSDFQSRFNCDAALMVRVFEENRTQAQFQRLIDAIKSGHISVPLTTLVNTYGGTPAEGVVRGMYYAGTLERRFNLRLPLALSMENQTLPWGLSSLWAGSGAKYSWRGVCGCVTRTPFGGQRDHEVYWYTGPDSQRVLMKWYSAANSNPDSSIGGYAEARFLPQAVDYVTVNAPTNGFGARYPFSVIGIFGFGWDNTGVLTNEFVQQAPLLSNASRRVIISNEVDFFQDFESTYANQIGSVNYTFGNEWELYQSSLAELTSRVRRSLEKSRAAEAMASVVSIADPTFMNGRDADRLLFNLGLGMYWEHDWTGDGGFAAEKSLLQRRLAGDIERYVNTLHSDAQAALGARITPTTLANPIPGAQQFYVFNPLGFARSDAADLPWSATGPVSVFDLSPVVSGGQAIEVPSQIVTINGVRSLRIWASDVPSVGYKVFEARPLAGQVFADAASVTAPPGSPTTATITYTIQSDDRDALSVSTGNPIHTVRVSGYAPGDQTVYWSNDSEEETAGLAFGITLPAGTVITDARLELRASESSAPNASGSSRIRAYDIDDAPPFANGVLGDIATRFPLTSQSVLWNAPTWTSGSTQTSPNIGAMVQAFINRPGYAPGKHLGLVIDEGTLPANSYYGFHDFSRPGGQPARLVVTYQTTTGGGATLNRVLANSSYALTVTPRGAIVSLIDKTRGNREFARSIGGRVINDLGGAAGADAAGTLSIENAGPVSVTLLATSTLPVAHTSRVTLFRSGDRIDLNNQITQNFSTNEDWGFGFEIATPRVRFEEVGAIAGAALRTQGGSYATQNARYDWLTLNHFADMSEGAAPGAIGVTLSNIDVPFFRLGSSSLGTLDTATPQISPVAGGRLDGPGLGLPNQGNDTLFTQRFALRTRDAAAATDASAMRFALEHANPLVTGRLTSPAATGTRLPSGRFSFLSVSNPDVLLWTLKPAEDGPSTPGGPLTMRLWNLASTPTSATVQSPWRPLRAALASTHIETIDASITPAPVTSNAGVGASFQTQQMRTFRTGVRCPADANADGSVAVSDIFAFLASWFARDPSADFDAQGGITVQDIFAFLAAWFTGC